MSIMSLEIEYVGLCKEVITSLALAKANSKRKAEIRQQLIEQEAWNPNRIERRMWS